MTAIFASWRAQWPAVILALAGLVTAAAYLPSLRGPFLFDDLSEIVDNPAIRTLLPPWRPMFEGGELPHRPIPYLTFACNYQAGRILATIFSTTPLDPLPFHAVNVAIHLLNGWLLYKIMSTLLAKHLPETGNSVRPTTVAAIAAAIWLVHPLQSQAVSYVYQRIELLAACATLTTCITFLRAAASPRPLPWIIASVVACAAGLACKEWAVVVPPLILLLDRTFLARSWRDVFSRRGGWHISLFATWPILFSIVATQRHRYPEAGFSPWQAAVYAANQPIVVLWYLSRLVVPVGLSIDHGAVLRQDLLGHDAWLLVPVVGVVSLAGWAVSVLPRRPAAAFSILACMLLLAPTSSLLPVQDVCVEHRMYLAAAIPIAAVVVAVASWLPYGAVAAAAAVVPLAAMTTARNTVYQSPLTVWQDAVAKSGGSSRSLARYGTELSRLDRHAEAVAACAAAVDRNPGNPVPHAALAAALLNADSPDQAAAVCRAGLGKRTVGPKSFRDPVLDRLDMYLGVALDRLDDPEGRFRLQAVVARRPDSLSAKEHLARSLLDADPRAAAALWAELVAATPADPYVLFNHGSALARFDPAAAVEVLTAAIAADPTNADASNNHGNALLTLGRHDEAVAAYRRCLQLAPDHPAATANLRALTAPNP